MSTNRLRTAPSSRHGRAPVLIASSFLATSALAAPHPQVAFPLCSPHAYVDPHSEDWGWERGTTCRWESRTSSASGKHYPNCTATAVRSLEAPEWGWDNDHSCFYRQQRNS